MQEALNNTRYKEIWEKVIMNAHPEAKTLIDALLLEAGCDNCLFIENGYIGIPHVFTNDCGYAYAFNFCSDYRYENNRQISFYDYEEHKRYDVNTGILLEEYTEEILNKERVLQHIVGRPITLFDVLALLNKDRDERDEHLYYADGKEIKAIFPDEFYCRKICDFHTNLLCETSTETWEKILTQL